MMQRLRAFIAIDEGGRYAISGGTGQDDALHVSNAVSAVEWPPGGTQYAGKINVYAIEVEVPTAKHTLIAEVAGQIKDKDADAYVVVVDSDGEELTIAEGTDLTGRSFAYIKHLVGTPDPAWLMHILRTRFEPKGIALSETP